MDREDMKHHISMLISEGQLHLAPIGPNPQLILDVGTGTGMIADKERHMGY
jgi:methylase of polypeptide subunit release factors